MTQRPLIAISIAFLLGIAAFALKLSSTVVFALILVPGVTVLFFKRSLLPFLLVLVISFFIGSLRTFYAEDYRSKIFAIFGSSKQQLTMTVTEFSDDGKVVAQFYDEDDTYNIYLDTDGDYGLLPGDIIEASVTFKKPYTDKTSLSDFATYMASRSVYLFGSTDKVKVTGRQNSGITGSIYTIRRYIDTVAEKHFSGNSRGLFSATVLGDKRFITDELDELLKISGLSHIAVVSGMHLSLLIAVQMMLLSKIFGRRRIGNALSIIIALLITLITGAGASVVRACVMCIIYQTAALFYRENDSLNTLAFTVLLMLLYNPYNLFNAGLVLSVLSVLGILLYNGKISRWLEKSFSGPLHNAAAVTISAQLMTCVPVIYYFGLITPYALLSNVLVTAFTTALLIASILLCFFQAVTPIGCILSCITKFICSAIITVCRFIKALPYSSIELNTLGPAAVIVWLFLLTVLYTGAGSKEKLKRITVIFTSLLLIATSLSIAAASKLKMSFISYGKSSMTAMHFPSGEALLLDCINSFDAAGLNDGAPYNFAVMPGSNPKAVYSLIASGKAPCVLAYEPAFSKNGVQRLKNDIELASGEVIFLRKNEYFYYGNVSVGFLDFNIKNLPPAVDIEYKGKHIVSLQDFAQEDIETLERENIYIFCDYIKLPLLCSTDNTKPENITNGKPITDTKHFSINLF